MLFGVHDPWRLNVQVEPELHEALDALLVDSLPTPNREIAFSTFWLPHLGQVGLACREGERTKTSNPTPHT